MPAGTSSKGKNAKRKSVKAAPVEEEQLGEHDRILEVRLCATITSAADVPEAALRSFLHCVFRGEERIVCLDEMLAKAEEEPVAKGKQQQQQRRAPPVKCPQEGDVDFLLGQRRIQVDLPTLTELLSEKSCVCDRVAVHAPPPPPPAPLALPQADASPGRSGAPSGGRGKPAKGRTVAEEPTPSEPTKAASSSGPSPSPGISPRGKRRASAAHEASRAEQLSGEQLVAVELSFLDVMHTTEHAYPLKLGFPGVQNCRVVLRCRNSCLTPLPILKRFRPVLFTVSGVENLPESVARSPVKVSLEGLGHRVISPSLSLDREGSAANRRDEDSESGQAPFLFRTVRFLGDMPPLSVYQSLLLDPVRVSVLRAEKTSDAMPSEQRAGRTRDEETTPSMLVGCGSFSVRDFITDRQTFFDVTVPLLPLRHAAAVASAVSSCLTSAAVVNCAVDFSLTLPPIAHVKESGEPAARDALMTRGVAILPFSASWMPSAIGCLLKQLMMSRRATSACDVRLYVEPPPRTTPGDTEESPPLSSIAAAAIIERGSQSAEPGFSSLQEAQSTSGKGVSSSTATNSTAKAGGGVTSKSFKRDGKEPNSGGSGGGEDLLRVADAEDDGDAQEQERWPFEGASVRVVSPAGISGFEVSDGTRRLVCLEGPANEVHRVFMALHNTVNAAVARAQEVDPALDDTVTASLLATAVRESGFRLLFNPELFAGRRLYARYPPLVTPPGNGVEGRGGVSSSSTLTDADLSSRGDETLPGGADVAEVDEMGGGCGGRIHRVRLCEPIAALMAHQRLFLRRTLSEGCLRCVLQLDALFRCQTIREASVRDLFPTAAGIISLERSFGQTLELPDIFGRDKFAPQRQQQTALPEDGNGATATSAVDGSWAETLRGGSTMNTGVDNGALRLAAVLDPDTPKTVGQLVSFQGGALLGKKRAVPAAVAARHPRTLWMMSDDGTEVLCAFGKDVPGGTIRYHVEGQVVQMDSLRFLYVLEFHTLAKSFTNSRNPQYEKVLAARRRQENLCGPPAQRLATALAHQGGQQAPAHAIANATGDDDDEAEDNDAHNPPVAEDSLESSQWPTDGDARGGGGVTAGLMGARGGTLASGTRTTALREALSQSKKEPAPNYELLWRLYDKRGPKHTMA